MVLHGKLSLPNLLAFHNQFVQFDVSLIDNRDPFETLIDYVCLAQQQYRIEEREFYRPYELLTNDGL